jgi:hypothetical protein
MWRKGRPGKGVENQVVDGSEPLDRSGYAVVARFSCGQSLVSRSLQVTIRPRHMRCGPPPPFAAIARGWRRRDHQGEKKRTAVE